MKVVAYSALLLIVASFSLNAQNSNSVNQSISPAPSVTSFEAQQLEITQQLAPIKSKVDLNNYLASHSAKESLLSALSPGGRQRFLASLKFGDKGLSSFNYSDLSSELTPTQAYQIMSLFGMQRTTSIMKGLKSQTDTDRLIMSTVKPQPLNNCPPYPTPGSGSGCDHEGYRCAGRATCMTEMSAICTSNC